MFRVVAETFGSLAHQLADTRGARERRVGVGAVTDDTEARQYRQFWELAVSTSSGSIPASRTWASSGTSSSSDGCKSRCSMS